MTNAQAKPIEETTNLEKAYIELQKIASVKSALDLRKKEIEEDLLKVYGDKIQSQLKAKLEPFGVVNILQDNLTLAVTVPKKIKWDQSKLDILVKAISAGGENPDDYIDTEYSVPEAKYKNWPSVIKEQFIGARTIEPGNPSIKLTSSV